MERRSFLKKIGGASLASTLMGSGLLTWVPRSEAATISKTYYITDGTITMPDGVAVYFQSFSDATGTLTIPGSSIVCQEGDTLSITVVNTLTKTHNFVIAGLKAGDPPLASTGNIASGNTGTISYTIPSGAAGSYLFYDNVTSYNRFLGLHGGLAIMPAGISNQLYSGSPTFVKQLFWVFNDIDPNLNSAVQTNTTIPTSFTPRYFTINGQTSLPPGATGNGDPTKDAMANPKTMLYGSIGDRTLIRMLNAGMASHAPHTHANHMEWLTNNGVVRSSVWKKDIIYLRNNLGKNDAIYPFEAPPDAYPPATSGHFPMHCHDEMSQTAGGGLYLFGAMTEIVFV
ncbi:MAG TPA: multicopper oxidase domain-containing protein [Sulfuriferula sp.]|nr:multicopper oxidase domain-containing protein [Sulfuriferula sp.]